MQRILLNILFLTLSLTVSAQTKDARKAARQMKADIETVKANLKSGKDLEKGEATLRRYLADSLYSRDISLHLLLADVVKKVYEAGNEKMYLKAKIDTANLLNVGRRMFIACQTLDSLDAMPNDKGISSPSHRKRNAEYLVPYRNNIFQGGLFFFSHRKWQEAWQQLDTYLDCRRQPLFSGTTLDATNDHYAAYVALVAANNLNNLEMAEKYASEALQYAPAHEVSLVMLTELSGKNNDTVKYVNYLKDGFRHYRHSQYFFPHLIDYYTSRKDYSHAMKYTDEALASDSLNTLFILAKHGLLMTVKRYDEALPYGELLIAGNDSLAQPNYNVGYIYYLRAQEAMKKGGMPYRQRIKNAQTFYRKCLPYMERFRRLRPGEKSLWRPVLYDAYLNLNMGKEFSEIEKE